MRRTRSRQDDNLGYQKPAPSERLTYREARSCTRWSTCPAPRAPSRVQGHTDLTASPLHQGQALSLLGLLPVATGSVEISFPTASSGRLPPGLQRRAKHAPCTPQAGKLPVQTRTGGLGARKTVGRAASTTRLARCCCFERHLTSLEAL